MKTKVAFVGPKEIHAALSEMDDNWDFQSPVETLSEFEDEINDSESTKISNETSIVILFSDLYDGDAGNHERFAYDAALIASYSAVIILATDDDIKDEINEAIKAQQAQLSDATSNEDEENQYSIDTPFYFMDYDNPQETLSNDLSEYVRNPLANQNSRNSILSSLPDSVTEDLKAQAETDEQFGDNSSYQMDDDTIVIPEASEDAYGKVITVTSSKGGSGKSTVSMLLGTYLAKGSKLAYENGRMKKPLKVLIFDFDTRDGQLGFLNGQQNPTIIDIVAAGSVTKESIRQGIYQNKNMGVDFIFSSKRPRYAANIPNDFFADVIQKLREMYDYIILDTSVNYLDPLLDSIAYPIADKIVFVTDVGISSIFGMMRWVRETTQSDVENRENINPNKIGIVVNKVLKDVNMGLDKIESAAGGIQVYAMLPSMPGLITYAANTSTLDQVLNQPIINRAIFNLAQQLVQDQNYQLAEVPSIK